uniref:(northern house mosquito) hypothetical protein n=1 Tax=Culex pipiens TaxID=7175 RepID=A0A8D8CNG5_CULPI
MLVDFLETLTFRNRSWFVLTKRFHLQTSRYAGMTPLERTNPTGTRTVVLDFFGLPRVRLQDPLGGLQQVGPLHGHARVAQIFDPLDHLALLLGGERRRRPDPDVAVPVLVKLGQRRAGNVVAAGRLVQRELPPVQGFQRELEVAPTVLPDLGALGRHVS